MKYYSKLDYELDNFDLSLLTKFSCYDEPSFTKLLKYAKVVGEKPYYNIKKDLSQLFVPIQRVVGTKVKIIRNNMVQFNIIVRLFLANYKFTQHDFDKFINWITFYNSKSVASRNNLNDNYIKKLAFKIMFIQDVYITFKQVDQIIRTYDPNLYAFGRKIEKVKKINPDYTIIKILNEKKYIFSKEQLSELVTKRNCPVEFVYNSVNEETLNENATIMALRCKNINLLKCKALRTLDQNILDVEDISKYRLERFNLNIKLARESYSHDNSWSQILKKYEQLFGLAIQKKNIYNVFDYGIKNVNERNIIKTNGVTTTLNGPTPYLEVNNKISRVKAELYDNRQLNFTSNTYYNISKTYNERKTSTKIVINNYYDVASDYLKELFNFGQFKNINIYCVFYDYYIVNCKKTFEDVIYYLEKCQFIGPTAVFIVYEFLLENKISQEETLLMLTIINSKFAKGTINKGYINVHSPFSYYNNFDVTNKLDNNLTYYKKFKNGNALLFMKLMYIVILEKTGYSFPDFYVNVLLWICTLTYVSIGEQVLQYNLNIDTLMKNMFVTLTSIKMVSEQIIDLICKYDLKKYIKVVGIDSFYVDINNNINLMGCIYNNKLLIARHTDKQYVRLRINNTGKAIIPPNYNRKPFNYNGSNQIYENPHPLNTEDIVNMVNMSSIVSSKRCNLHYHPNFSQFADSFTLGLLTRFSISNYVIYKYGSKILSHLNMNERYFINFYNGTISLDLLDSCASLKNMIIFRHICNYETVDVIRDVMKTLGLKLDNYCKFAMIRNNMMAYNKFFGFKRCTGSSLWKNETSTLISWYCRDCNTHHPWKIDPSSLAFSKSCYGLLVINNDSDEDKILIALNKYTSDMPIVIKQLGKNVIKYYNICISMEKYYREDMIVDSKYSVDEDVEYYGKVYDL
jgi:hypothetical protein